MEQFKEIVARALTKPYTRSSADYRQTRRNRFKLVSIRFHLFSYRSSSLQIVVDVKTKRKATHLERPSVRRLRIAMAFGILQRPFPVFGFFFTEGHGRR